MYMGYDDSYFEDYKIVCCSCKNKCYMWEHKCPNCGHEMYHPSFISDRRKILDNILEIARMDEEQEQFVEDYEKEQRIRTRNKEPMFTEEEMLVTGLYPKTPFFKEHLILKILDKD